MSQVQAPEAPAVDAEAPFQLQLALVYGEALTEMPVDLYIPPDALKSSSKPSKARWTCCCT